MRFFGIGVNTPILIGTPDEIDLPIYHAGGMAKPRVGISLFWFQVNLTSIWITMGVGVGTGIGGGCR